ncbi:hypothetical protein ACX0G7_08220 [Flavitalea antarctica]
MKTILEVPYLETIVSGDFPETQRRKKQFTEYMRMFGETCDRRHVRWGWHRDSGLPLEELIGETRFADLLIADPGLKFDESDHGFPSHFIESLLVKSECPVIMAPSSFEGIDEVIFAYDGTASSVFAIKQFTYLLQELSDKRMIVIQAHKDGNLTIDEKARIGELLQPHYSSVAFHPVQGDSRDALLDYLLGKKNVFLVLGSYGGSMLSRFYHKSTASRLIRTFDIPVFIAHR